MSVLERFLGHEPENRGMRTEEARKLQFGIHLWADGQ